MEYYYGLLAPLTITFAWILVFHMVGRYRQIHDRLLLVLLCCCGLELYVGAREYVSGCGDYLFVILDDLESFIALFIPPLLFLYMRTVAIDAHWRRWYYWLFVPGMVIGVMVTVLSFVVGWDRLIENREGTIEMFVPAENNVWENIYDFVDITLYNMCLEVMAVVLILLSLNYLIMYRKHIDQYYSNIEDTSSGSMHYFLLSSTMFMISMFVITLAIEYLVDFTEVALLCVSVWMAILLWNMAFYAYRIKLIPEHLEEIHEVVKKTAVKSENKDDCQNSVDHMEGVLLQKIIEWKSGEDKPFCHEGLTLTDLSSVLEVTPRMLSEYINKQFGMNFNRWINTMRIEEAKKMLHTSGETKIGYVASVCGFADQAAFSKVFRSIEGCSPMAYRDSVSQ